jgi:hypothetical protein
LNTKTFIQDATIFKNNVNKSVIEYGQIVDTLQIALEKLEDAVTSLPLDEKSEIIRVESLLEIVIGYSKERLSINEEITGRFEQQCFKMEAIHENQEREVAQCQ